MTTYRVPASHPLKTQAVTIEAVEGENAIPAMMFTQRDERFGIDARKLAANMASLLNGKTPAYQLGVDNAEMFYQRIPDGIVLRHRSEGTSQEAVTLVVNGGAGNTGRALLDRLTPAFMTSLMATMNPSAQTSGPAPTQRTPSHAP